MKSNTRKVKKIWYVDALSHVEGSEILHMALSVLECGFILHIEACYEINVAINFNRRLKGKSVV